MEETKKESVEVVDIQFRPGQKIYFFSPNGMTFKAGDHVIIDTARGAEFGIVTGGNHRIPDMVFGLWEVSKIINSNPSISLTTEKDEKYFIQKLIIAI